MLVPSKMKMGSIPGDLPGQTYDVYLYPGERLGLIYYSLVSRMGNDDIFPFFLTTAKVINDAARMTVAVSGRATVGARIAVAAAQLDAELIASRASLPIPP